MRHDLQARYPEYAEKVKFYIGDVRNPQTIKDAMWGVDYVFHVAALKQVPSCEFFSMEAVRTNSSSLVRKTSSRDPQSLNIGGCKAAA